ncbi:septum formation initiator family protein [Curvibacter sp. RS43]|uniref:Cell division protein FtsB n=1 Tax=Curvibacter microcysteis TaxID=3026419 RepID=A0ABT5MK14_9BURK|nr:MULTISPECIES: septum formation initiator family protein [unclassified Curvibacter]MDD0812781.1 septum formation initiator family protein [Curvibacter sp. RS43]MDD0816908.1 septum formation initiator family protein [Curvibacter sp. HBC28]
MGVRLLPVLLLAVLGLLHAQLWLGRGSIPNVAGLQQKIDEQKARNAAAQRINDQLASEVNDLKEGLAMVEERSRIELGMVKPNEIFVQITK